LLTEDDDLLLSWRRFRRSKSGGDDVEFFLALVIIIIVIIIVVIVVIIVLAGRSRVVGHDRRAVVYVIVGEHPVLISDVIGMREERPGEVVEAGERVPCDVGRRGQSELAQQLPFDAFDVESNDVGLRQSMKYLVRRTARADFPAGTPPGVLRDVIGDVIAGGVVSEGDQDDEETAAYND